MNSLNVLLWQLEGQVMLLMRETGPYSRLFSLELC